VAKDCQVERLLDPVDTLAAINAAECSGGESR
jgi:hypothetical protein